MSNEQKELCKEYWINTDILNEEQAIFKLNCLIDFANSYIEKKYDNKWFLIG